MDPDKGIVVEKIFSALDNLIKDHPENGKGLPIEIWVGSSHDLGGHVRRYLKMLYDQNYHKDIAIVIFPGHPFQISRKADWVMYPNLLNNHSLLLSLLEKTGKVYFAFFRLFMKLFRRHFPEIRKFGYYVVDQNSSVGRKLKSKEYTEKEAIEVIKRKSKRNWSGTYIEGGSGVDISITSKKDLLKQVRSYTLENNKIMYVGGGIRSKKDVEYLKELGVDIIVISTVFEEHDNPIEIIQDFIGVLD